MPVGIMQRWNSEKGFGFIRPSDGGEDLFCHVSGLMDGEGSVRDGDEVRFRISYDDRKGKDRATEVELAYGGSGRGLDRSRSRSRGHHDSRSGGGKGGGKSGGKPGDWDCPECGVMVFASKDACFKCGARKSSGGRRGSDRDRSRGRDRDRSRDRDRRRH
eukprot:TRINITY_DN24063_c0_g1_i1.p1 TRINITY_DN24063_c0_g1~~TRINITY_DN24063_c0_g1_i1.p1  ORF type:complete len:160 (-),score=13.85 TRINITY_DN24063_c0_g1_i1:307-786(-)